MTTKIDETLTERAFFDDFTEEDNAEIIVGPEWSDEGKCSSGEVVFKSNGVLYKGYGSRWGSYRSDYDYSFDVPVEVEAREKVIVEYVEKSK